MNLQERMEFIKKDILELKESDPDFKVPAAEDHKYELGETYTEEQVQAFEKANGFRLPEDFRWFIINVSSTGKVGPEHSCYKLNLKKKIKGEFPLKYGEMYSMSAFEEEYEEFDDACAAIYIASEKAEKGQITIGYDPGNHAEMNLILNGPAAGTVWSVDFSTDTYGAFPLSRMNDKGKLIKEPMTFADWFEEWLNLSLGAEDMDDISTPEYCLDFLDVDDFTHISIPQKEFDAYKAKEEAAKQKKKAKQEKEERENPVTLSFDEWVKKMNSQSADTNIETTEKVLQLIESGNLVCSDTQRNLVRNSLLKKIAYWMGTSLCRKEQYLILRDKLIAETKKALELVPYPAPKDDTMINFNESEWQGIPYKTEVWNKDMYMRAANLFAWYTYETKGDLNEALRVVESALIYDDVIAQFFYWCIYDTQVRILLALGRKEDACTAVENMLSKTSRHQFNDFEKLKTNAAFLEWLKNKK